MAKVSVITRTKDRTVFLERAILSVANQTYEDYQHTIINDGGSIEAVDNLIASLDKKVKVKIQVFHRPESSNAPDTIFNESIDRTKSDYVAIHDDDDTWHSEFLERTVAVLDGGSMGVVVRADKITEDATKSLKPIKIEHYLSNMRAVSLYRQCIDNQLTPIAFIYRRGAYEDAGKYDSSLPVVGDWEFGIRFLQKYDVDYLDPGFALANYHHRISKDNSFQANDHRRTITMVFNRYLRQELREGKLGVGYIMNSLRYEQDMLTDTVRRLLPKPLAKFIQRKVR